MTAQSRAITAIRMLAADSVQKANSGHPGMPIGSIAPRILLGRRGTGSF